MTQWYVIKDLATSEFDCCPEKELPEYYEVIRTFDTDSWNEAMTWFHETMGFDPYECQDPDLIYEDGNIKRFDYKYHNGY